MDLSTGGESKEEKASLGNVRREVLSRSGNAVELSKKGQQNSAIRTEKKPKGNTVDRSFLNISKKKMYDKKNWKEGVAFLGQNSQEIRGA